MPPPPPISQVRIRYKRGFFINDPTIEFLLGKILLGKGQMQSDIDLLATAASGKHSLRIKYFIRDQNFQVEIPHRKCLVVDLLYSRMWGNFKIKTSVSELILD